MSNLKLPDAPAETLSIPEDLKKCTLEDLKEYLVQLRSLEEHLEDEYADRLDAHLNTLGIDTQRITAEIVDFANWIPWEENEIEFNIYGDDAELKKAKSILEAHPNFEMLVRESQKYLSFTMLDSYGILSEATDDERIVSIKDIKAAIAVTAKAEIAK